MRRRSKQRAYTRDKKCTGTSAGATRREKRTVAGRCGRARDSCFLIRRKPIDSRQVARDEFGVCAAVRVQFTNMEWKRDPIRQGRNLLEVRSWKFGVGRRRAEIDLARHGGLARGNAPSKLAGKSALPGGEASGGRKSLEVIVREEERSDLCGSSG